MTVAAPPISTRRTCQVPSRPDVKEDECPGAPSPPATSTTRPERCQPQLRRRRCRDRPRGARVRRRAAARTCWPPPQGTEKMQSIAAAVQEGASAFLTRQFRTLGGVRRARAGPAHAAACRRHVGIRVGRSVFFLVGALFSVLHRLRWAWAWRPAPTCAWRPPPVSRTARRTPSRSPSAPAASSASSPSASACSVPRPSSSSTRATRPRCSRASASAPPCSPCSSGSAAASSPRPPTSAPTSSARSSRASPRTTRATPRPSPTTSATTSATAPAWPRTCSSPTPSCWSRRSSSARPPSARKAWSSR